MVKIHMMTRMWSNSNYHSLLMGMKNGKAALEDSLAVSYKTKHILLAQDPATVLLDIYPNKMKIYIHTNTCTQMFILPLFIICKTWNNQDVHQYLGK